MVHFAHPHAFVFEDSGAEVEAVAFLSQTEYRVLCYIPYIWQLKEHISHHANNCTLPRPYQYLGVS